MQAAECRARARECLELAEKLPEGERTALLEIAQAWLQLARDVEPNAFGLTETARLAKS